jgi:hypothetical protein
MLSVGLAAAVAATTGVTRAEDFKSGLPVGTPVEAFQVVKCGGAVDDGVKVGAQLCYR